MAVNFGLILGGIAFYGVAALVLWKARARPVDSVEIIKSEPTAYEFDENPKIVDLGEVPIEDVEELLRRKLEGADRKYETGELAMAATVFGISRSDGHYMEFDCMGQDEIIVRAGDSITGLDFEEEVTLSGFLPAMRLVESYFQDAEAFSGVWRALPDRRKF